MTQSDILYGNGTQPVFYPPIPKTGHPLNGLGAKHDGAPPTSRVHRPPSSIVLYSLSIHSNLPANRVATKQVYGRLSQHDPNPGGGGAGPHGAACCGSLSGGGIYVRHVSVFPARMRARRQRQATGCTWHVVRASGIYLLAPPAFTPQRPYVIRRGWASVEHRNLNWSRREVGDDLAHTIVSRREAGGGIAGDL